MEALSKFYDSHKVLFFLLLVPIVILMVASIAIPGIRTWLFDQVNKKIAKTVEKDNNLKKESDEAKAKAAEHQAKADELAAKRKKEESEEDADWNKKQ